MRKIIDCLAAGMTADELNAIASRNTDIRDGLYKDNPYMEPVGGEGGSPPISDLLFLSLLVRKLKPKVAFEFGSWVGTSATVIAEAGAGIVYTCDKRKCYTGTNEKVHFRNQTDRQFVIKIIDETRFVDFCFIDANVCEDAGSTLLRYFKPGRVAIAIHDMDMHNGLGNMIRLTCRNSELQTFYPDVDAIANGVVVNHCVGLILGTEIAKELGL